MTLVDWIGHQAAIVMPLDKYDIHLLIFDISGIVPGSKWINCFEKHHPEIHVSWPGNLDPKCAQNFNPTNICHFYKFLKHIYNTFPNLPPKHIWNMDEKGVQFRVPPSFVLSSGPFPSLPNLSGKIVAIATSPNGWTNNEIGTAWFTEMFIPFANDHKVANVPIVFLLDGHNSHELDVFCEAAFYHNIIVITFPSKCTHKLQPLDVVIFAQVQHH